MKKWKNYSVTKVIEILVCCISAIFIFANACASTQGNHRQILKRKTQTQTHQKAWTHTYAHTHHEQQTHKNTNKHEHREIHMFASEEGASTHTWVGRVHMNVVERREMKTGWGGARKGTGGHIVVHAWLRRDTKRKSNTTNRPQKTAKTI